MVGIAQLARAPDCGSGGRRFEPDYPPHFFKRSREIDCALFLGKYIYTLGCRQGVRQGTLTPLFAGSNPAIPAKGQFEAAAHPSETSAANQNPVFDVFILSISFQ